MTIDIGYAHLALPDGTELDFVDVPGHDRLVGNMLVGAGEIDAALLVVAADDGLRAQTHEHIDLLDGLAVRHALVAITKADLVPGDRTGEVREAVGARLASTALAEAPIVVVSGSTGDGIEELRTGLVGLRDRVLADPAWVAQSAKPVRLAVDRAFRIKGRGTVVTGTLRGGPLPRGTNLRIVPGDADVRVREIQVHGAPVEDVAGGGRTALNLAGEAAAGLHRGIVLTSDPDVHSSDRWIVMLTAPVPDRARFRVHLGTAAAEAVVGRSGRDALDLAGGAAAAVLRLDASLAAATGDRFVLRRAASSGPAVVGGVILDPLPARGVSRRRQTPERVAALAVAVQAGDRPAVQAARVELHGIVAGERQVAPDVRAAGRDAALDAVRAHHAARPGDAGPTLAAVRSAAARGLRRHATASAADAATRAAAVVDELESEGRIVRDGDRARAPDHQPSAADPEVEAAMDRLVEALAVLAPPSLREAAAATGCPPPAIRELERNGRIVVLDEDLAYAMPTYRDLAAKALALASREPLTPAAFRDATGTSRRYVLGILEDLDRRGILLRTPAGHVPGPRAPAGVRGGA